MIASSRKPPSDVMGLFIQTCDINLDESIFCSNIITLFASKTPYEAIKLVYRVSNVITKSEKLDFYLNSNLLLRNYIDVLNIIICFIKNKTLQPKFLTHTVPSLVLKK